MRAIVVSGGVLGVAAVFGLGVVFGRFVLDRPAQPTELAQNEVYVPYERGYTIVDPPPPFQTDGDRALDTLPQAPAGPLPPATQEGAGAASATTGDNPARSESELAAAGGEENNCSVRVAEDAAVRSWSSKDRVSATAIGSTCGKAIVRIMLETPEGSALYALQAPARDFGIGETATPDEVRAKLTTLLPTNAVRAAAYPAWEAGSAPPTSNEFTRETYEAIRAANHPVICLKLPSASQRCVAADPTTKQIKVFSRG